MFKEEIEKLARTAAYGLKNGFEWGVTSSFTIVLDKKPGMRQEAYALGKKIEDVYGRENGYPSQEQLYKAVMLMIEGTVEHKDLAAGVDIARRMADNAYEAMGEKRAVDHANEEEVKAYQARSRAREGGIKTRHAFSEGKTRKRLRRKR